MKSFAEKFRPLTHVEIVTHKPLRVKVGNTKWIWEHNLQSAVNFMRFLELKDHVLKVITDAVDRKQKKVSPRLDEDSFLIIRGVTLIVGLLWEVGKKPEFFITRFRMKIAFFQYFTMHTDELFEMLENCLSFNARLLQFASVPSEIRSVSNREMDSDGFLSLCGLSVGAHNEPWLLLCERLEYEKQRAIAQYKQNESSRKNQKRK